MPRIAVIGAGIAGLSAAWELERNGAEVVVLEARAQVGGKLRRSEVPELGFPIDEGADAFLARVPEALELCAELGIDDLVNPATGRAWVYAHGTLRPLPERHLLGIPTDPDDLAATGLVSPAAVDRVRAETTEEADAPSEDLAVGSLVRSRLGDEVCDHLVEPLLGGINAGEADLLSTQAVAPQIWAAAVRGGSLVRAAAEIRSAASPTPAPVFATPAAGMAELPVRLADRLSAERRTGHEVSSLEASRSGARVDGEAFDGVVLAVPADACAPLLSTSVPVAAESLAEIEFASVVMVTVVADASAVDHPLDGSGFVVPRTAGLDITAASWGSSKWAHWDDGRHAVFRISLGHDTDPVDWCSKGDDELVAAAVAGLATAIDTEVTPVGARVGRWARSFPQYRPGHVDRVEAVHASLAEAGPLVAAGASLGGIGVPACIRQGREAARRLLAR